MNTKIGFVGLGIMGKPMVKNLIKNGFETKVFNRSQSPVEELLSTGAIAAHSAAAAAENVDAVITMLANDQAVESIYLGENGIIQGIQKGTIAVDMSTTSPDTARKIDTLLKERGATLLDAPVSGGDVGAADASLSIMVGGDEAAFDKMLPIFKAMGRNISHVGESGAGQIAKCANQIIVALTIEAVSEALLLVHRSGADPEKVRNALMGGFAQSRVLELHGQRMIQRNFEPGGKVSIHKKDNEIALELASRLNLYLPGTSLVSQLWNAASAQNGGQDWDHSGLLRLLELMSNTTISNA